MKTIEEIQNEFKECQELAFEIERKGIATISCTYWGACCSVPFSAGVNIAGSITSIYRLMDSEAKEGLQAILLNGLDAIPAYKETAERLQAEKLQRYKELQEEFAGLDL